MDILTDLTERLQTTGVPPEITQQVVSELRRDWGGENAYIPRHSEPPQHKVSRRNADLVRDWQRGERVKFLARKYGISVKRVYAVLKLSRASLKGKTAPGG